MDDAENSSGERETEKTKQSNQLMGFASNNIGQKRVKFN